MLYGRQHPKLLFGRGPALALDESPRAGPSQGLYED